MIDVILAWFLYVLNNHVKSDSDDDDDDYNDEDGDNSVCM